MTITQTSGTESTQLTSAQIEGNRALMDALKELEDVPFFRRLLEIWLKMGGESVPFIEVGRAYRERYIK